jgi:hypothetical protein
VRLCNRLIAGESDIFFWWNFCFGDFPAKQCRTTKKQYAFKKKMVAAVKLQL